MSQEQYKYAAAHLLSKTKVRPQVGIICGSGLSMLSDSIENPEVFEYGVSYLSELLNIGILTHYKYVLFGSVFSISYIGYSWFP